MNYLWKFFHFKTLKILDLSGSCKINSGGLVGLNLIELTLSRNQHVRDISFLESLKLEKFLTIEGYLNIHKKFIGLYIINLINFQFAVYMQEK